MYGRGVFMYRDPGFKDYKLGDQRFWARNDPPPAYAGDPYDINTNLREALRLIENALKGETEDKLFYQYLISVAQSADDKNVISGIRDDEMKHYQLFRQLYQELTGNIPGAAADTAFEKPASYCAGLRKALMGEQNAVTFYRRILYAMKHRKHINIMTEIITDELRHLGLYNYLFAKNKCTV
jgi:rubrerythrin